jgi:hypothetical protein
MAEAAPARSIAVITNALTDGFFFPTWHRYYGDLIGHQNLYVLTYQGLSRHFHAYELGGYWELPHSFDDNRNARTISRLVDLLLDSYDLVVRVDVDEILVPDLRLHSDLASYLRTMKTPYVTVRGFDVIQTMDEPPLDWSRPILIEQRLFAYANSSLNKTCATTIPLVWSGGFHGSSGYPQIGELFMLHLKWVDGTRLLDWYSHMTAQAGDNAHLATYYLPDIGRIDAHRRRMSTEPVDGGWEAMWRKDFNAQFMRQLHFSRSQGTWEPRHGVEQVLLRLPETLRGLV